jgi:hypothetical protein
MISDIVRMATKLARERLLWWATPTALFVGYVAVVLFAYR